MSGSLGRFTEPRSFPNGRESVMSSTAVEIPRYAAGPYAIDPGHSDVAFSVRHLMVSKVRGHFTRFQGELTLPPDPRQRRADLARGDPAGPPVPGSQWLP